MNTFLCRSAFVGTVFVPALARACPQCATSQRVWSAIETTQPARTLGVLVAAFVVVLLIIIAAARAMRTDRLVFAAALLIGAGMGALLDGIGLHQILQWHAMLSSELSTSELVPAKLNMFWDGVFHLFAWSATLGGIALLTVQLGNAPQLIRPRFVGAGGLAGWGIFNVVEGVLDHHIFRLHHVHPGIDEFAWDVGFVLFGAGLAVVGFFAARSMRTASRA